MNLHKPIRELRRQLQVTNEVIIALERLESKWAPKRGRPPKKVDSNRLKAAQRGDVVRWPANPPEAEQVRSRQSRSS